MRASRGWIGLQFGVALVLLGSYSYVWHSRDWNTASRLILTYAVVDRGTIVLDGLDRQTGDIARFRGHYYCDKLPGFSLWGAVPYGIGRLLGLPPHPLGGPALAYWPADYWVTLGSSGLFTVLAAVMLMRLARTLGCTPGRAALVGLAYGLATPAYVYATLAYGHQLSACVLLGSLLLLLREPGRGRERGRMLAAGMLAALGPVVELQVAPVAVILGLYLLAQCAGGVRRPDALAWFGLGALLPTLCLLGYNVLAFGSPWEMGYFHHATARFAQVHNRGNPLGLRRPDLALIGPLLWGQYRGLFFYAPILLLAPPGWIVLMARRRFAPAGVSLAIVLAVFAVNLSYPEWTGGWSTGPRLLVPLLPFAMIPVAGLLGGRRRGSRAVLAAALALALGGGVLMFLFQGVGARVPQDVRLPFTGLVWPLWAGTTDLPRWWTGQRFAVNLAALAAPELAARWPRLQFVPLLAFQGLGLAAIAWAACRAGRSDLGVDQEQERHGADEEAQDPEAEPQGVRPDAGP